MVAVKSVEYTQWPIDCRQCIEDRYLACKLPGYTMLPTEEYGNYPYSSYREKKTINQIQYNVL